MAIGIASGTTTMTIIAIAAGAITAAIAAGAASWLGVTTPVHAALPYKTAYASRIVAPEIYLEIEAANTGGLFLKRLINDPRSCRCVRIFDLQPRL
jgi:hypothetical protein